VTRRAAPANDLAPAAGVVRLDRPGPSEHYQVLNGRPVDWSRLRELLLFGLARHDAREQAAAAQPQPAPLSPPSAKRTRKPRRK
jgi:hypothetical protein